MADEEVVQDPPEQQKAPEQSQSERITREVADMSTVDATAMVKGLIENLAIQDAADQTLRRIKDSIERSPRSLPPDEFRGSDKDADSAKGKANRVKQAVQQILAAGKQDKIEISADAAEHIPEFAGRIIKRIAAKTDVNELTGTNSPFYYEILEKLISGDVTDNEQMMREFSSSSVLLYLTDRSAYAKIREALAENALADGIPEDLIEQAYARPEKFATNESTPVQDTDVLAEAQFNGDWQQKYSPYFNGENSFEFKFLKTLYSPHTFAEFIKGMDTSPEYQERYQSEFEGITDPTEIWQKKSEILEREIMFLYSRIFSVIHTQRQGKFFEEIAQENFMSSMNSAKDTLTYAINRLSDRFNDDTLRKEGLEEAQFFTRGTTRKLGTRTVQVDHTGDHEKDYKQINWEKVIPTAGRSETQLREFLIGVRNHSGALIDHQTYLHNVQSLFLRGAKDGSFWGQIAGYAEQNMSAVDIDDLTNLPDSDIMMSAYQLYTKYVEEDFAKFSWRHQPGQFQSDFMKSQSRIQASVLEDLKKLYPNLAETENTWRLEQAVNMGVGVSRGVFLTEVEAAAWADPGHSGTGGAAYQSYYTNDNAALLAFNPRHNWDRWKAPGVTLGPLVHIPVEGLDRKFLATRWDHRKLWDEMARREDSYKIGQRAYSETSSVIQPGPPEPKKPEEPKDPGDDATAVAKFRYKREMSRYNRESKAYPGRKKDYDEKNAKHMAKVKDNDEKHRFGTKKQNNERTSFIEYAMNIGKIGSPIDRAGWRFEGALDGWMVRQEGHHGTEIDRTASWKAMENIGFEAARWFSGHYNLTGPDNHGRGLTDELGAYLYNQYINPDGADKGSYSSYMKNLGDKPQETFMNHVFARMIKQRMPTKFIRLDRDRYSDDGKRDWDKVRIKSGLDAEEMDQAMKNLLLVEQMTRNNVSEEMKKQIADQVKTNPGAEDLSKVALSKGNEYRVTEESARRMLEKMLPDDAPNRDKQINDAIKVFQEADAIQNEAYLNEKAGKIADYPFKIGAEELDTSFMAFRNAGNTVLKRALGDIGKIETDVVNNIMGDFFHQLHHIAIDGSHSFAPLVESISKAKHAIEGVHGEPAAHKVAEHMAKLAVAYYKKDSRAKNIFTSWLHMGEPHSLAGHFAGGSWKGVWEWEAADLNSFAFALERAVVLPKHAYNANEPLAGDGEHHRGTRDSVIVPKKFLGFIPMGHKVILADEGGITIDQFKRDIGGTNGDIAWEILNKYALLAGVALVYSMIRKATKEEQGGKH